METQSIGAGAKLAESAFQTDSKHPWMIHTVCHSMEYSGQVADALDLLMDKRDCYKDSKLGFHNTWHVGYFQAG